MRTIVMLALVAVLAVTTWADNFSGHWTIETPGSGGQAQRTSLELNQNGSTVTGTLSGRIDPGTASPVNNEIWGGKVDGDTITFYVWRGSDKPWKQSYKGTLSGDQITFTVADAPHQTISFGPTPKTASQNASVQVVAKRSD